MKLFKLTMGVIEHYGAADSLDDMHDKRAEVNETFSYLPVEIEEVTLEGFDIVVKKKRQVAE